MRLEGKVALITGGGTGIGLEIARAYDEALADIGASWVSTQTSPKPYPFGFVAFVAIDAACALGSLADGAARITVDGDMRSVSCDAAHGTADRGLSIRETIDKFCGICGIEHPEPVVAAVMEADMPLRRIISFMG